MPATPATKSETEAPQARLWSSGRVPLLLCGLLSGLHVLIATQWFTARFGNSLPMASGMGLAWALGLSIAIGNSRSAGFRRTTSLSTIGLPQLGLAFWSVLFPVGLRLIEFGLGKFSIEALAIPGVTLLVGVTAGVATLTLPAWLIARQMLSVGKTVEETVEETVGETVATMWYGQGIVLGLLAGAFFGGPLLGLDVMALITSLAGCLVFVGCLYKHFAAATTVGPDENNVTTPRKHRLTTSRHSALQAAGLILVLGMVTALVCQVIDQLMPRATYTVLIQWAAVVSGLIFGCWSVVRKQTGMALPIVCCVVAVGGVAVPVVFPWLTNSILTVNAYVSQVWLLMPVRGLFVVGLLFPLGYAWGAICSRISLERNPLSESFPFAFVMGWVAGRWLVLPQLGVANGLAIAAIVFAMPLCWQLLRTRRLPIGAWRRTALGAAACAIVLGIGLRDCYDPSRSARLLFSTDVMLSLLSGLDRELLTVLDESRLVETRETGQATYTVWKNRGSQLRIRENGVPKAFISTAPELCPQVTPEILHVVLPLVIHSKPRRVLLLGVGSGLGMTTTLAFPVEQVTCVDRDAELIDVVRNTVHRHNTDRAGTASIGLDDPRAQFCAVDPVLAVACTDQSFDVVISNGDASALHGATSYYTSDFYRKVARRLNRNGVFCQRFSYVDYGVKPIQQVIATLRSAFHNVIVLEPAVGELMLLASDSMNVFEDEALRDRMSGPHVRRALAELGWDWSVPLSLPVFTPTSLSKFLEEPGLRTNTARNSWFAFQLPIETMRWGNKRAEIHKRTDKLAGNFLQQLPADEETIAISRRVDEIKHRRKLNLEQPDEPWAYRTLLRDLVRRSPRSAILQVGGGETEQDLHPEDERRLDYFKALGEIASIKPLQAADVSRLESFTVPFDSFLSYFAHREAAELLARTETPSPREELAHRLHVVHYADPFDRSVRNVAMAIDLLAKHPEAEPDATRRRDQLDGLFQIMMIRWQNRQALKPKSTRLALVDVGESVACVESAFEAMDELDRSSAGNNWNWSVRRRYLERSLLRPLRDYRSQVLSHHVKGRRKTRRLLNSLDDSSE